MIIHILSQSEIPTTNLVSDQFPLPRGFATVPEEVLVVSTVKRPRPFADHSFDEAHHVHVRVNMLFDRRTIGLLELQREQTQL